MPATDAKRFGRAAVLMLAISFVASDAWALDPRWHGSLSPAEQARLIALQTIAAAYVFTLGAVLGSFLNVVIYRLPRGMDIVRPRSRCPACATPIELRDNIPVLGWLLLRGKCRICGGPISPRYPLVEATVGSVLLILFWLEVRLGGVNLPHWTPVPLDELMILSWRMPWGNFVLAGYHAWLLVTLLVMALIQGDGLRVPASIVRLALAVGLLLPLAGPWLRPVPSYVTTILIDQRPWWHGGLDGLAGAAIGLLMGSLLAALKGVGSLFAGGIRHRRIDSACRRQTDSRPLFAAMLLVGVFLGWQAAVVIALISAMALIAARVLALVWPSIHNVPPLIWPTLATFFTVPLWKFVSQLPLLDLLYP